MGLSTWNRVLGHSSTRSIVERPQNSTGNCVGRYTTDLLPKLAARLGQRLSWSGSFKRDL